MKEKLNKLRLNQQRVWREYANRGVNEVGTTATGILTRRAKLLERSGILEEEEEVERQAEAEVRAEATRRLVASRAQVEREERKDEDDCAETDDEPLQEFALVETISDEMLQIEIQADAEEPLGAHWIHPNDLVEASEVYVPDTGEGGEAVEEKTDNVDLQDILYDSQHSNDDNQGVIMVAEQYIHERNADLGVDSEPEIAMAADDENHPDEAKMIETEHSLRRMHTSPIITVKERINDVPDFTKRTVKSTVTLPDIVVESTSDYSGHETHPENKTENDVDENEDTFNTGDVQKSYERSERLLPPRKQTTHSNMIQPAYFRSKTMKTKIQIPPATSTPPQIRRAASPSNRIHHASNISPTDSPNMTKKSSAKFRRISSPAKTMQTGANAERAASPKDSRKLTANLRRISSPNPPSPVPVFYSRSPSQAASPETTRENSNPQAWSPGQNTRELKEKFLLESKMYIPKASKNERRVIVPDKGEMLVILEEQKRELQKRIDKFLARQIRRSKFEQE